eukprot:TRINITY_DN49542_c0_g1_i1.p1 TRINITY_DN49542_c0_g1~~TRINITY_DN49542_c0_g1_i1.p1  ORF type:complete len:245 (-),score=40.05 TRINITY_DN49542_c0_g1_i1:12-746(-)
MEVTFNTISGNRCSAEFTETSTVMDAKVMVEEALGIPASAQMLYQGADLLLDLATLRESGVTDGTSLMVMRDPKVLTYGQSLGIFSNQNAGKGKDGEGTRLDLSSACVKTEALAVDDTPMTRVVLRNVDSRGDNGPVKMGDAVAIFNMRETKRVDMGSFCVESCPAARDDSNTRLFFQRLDGPNQGAIHYGHVVALLSESGKRLDMSTMGRPDHESWATRVFVLALSEDGELTRDDIECKQTHA